MSNFYINLIEHFRTVVGDSNFKEIDVGGAYSHRITVVYGNKEYEVSIKERDVHDDAHS